MSVVDEDYVTPYPHSPLPTQLSDVHISIYRDPARTPDLRLFTTDVLQTVQPSLVVVTGDLTDSKQQDQFLSRQYEQEWKMYASAIVDVSVPWLD